MTIRVALIDDHRRIHTIVAKILEATEDISLVGQGHNGQDALDICKHVQPDIVLMDIVMPVMDGEAATQLLHQQYPDMAILVLSSYADHQSVRNMLLSGARGYLLKDGIVRELVSTIRATYEGSAVFSPEIAQQLAAEPASLSPALDFNLTDRELAVLGLLAEGETLAQIGHDLQISHSTVKFHLSNIQDKLSVTTRAEVLVVAVKNNLV